MNEELFFNSLITGWFILAILVLLALFFIAAPYGRHSRRGWGPALNSRMGWIIMEAGAPLVFSICFGLGSNARTLPAWFFLFLWVMHYSHRAFIYPLMLHDKGRQIPLLIVGLGLVFNTLNAYLNGRYIFSISSGYGNSWLGDVRFITGLSLFIIGFVVNRKSDQVLRSLREPGEAGYKIPYGWLYRWITCPNYLGEIMIWLGWALATWSLPGLAFAIWTLANLAPRARSHHKWYREHFPAYPVERKALIPGLW